MIEIHTWWPYLSIPAKQDLREEADARIPPLVREEIESITGEALAPEARLSEDDREYIRTQREPVD